MGDPTSVKVQQILSQPRTIHISKIFLISDIRKFPDKVTSGKGRPTLKKAAEWGRNCRVARRRTILARLFPPNKASQVVTKVADA